MLRYALLTLLDATPMSGYDLNKVAGSSVGFCWPAAHSQIYTELKKLEGSGLIAGEEIPQAGRPNKTVYRVTDDGRADLAEWAASPIPMVGHKDPTTLRVFALGHDDPAHAAALLEQHLVEHRERLALYRAVAEMEFGGDLRPDTWRRTVGVPLALDGGIRFEESWIAWLEDLVAFCRSAAPEPVPDVAQFADYEKAAEGRTIPVLRITPA
ncbi:MAG: PadR family transcriptional regulator [Actinomycetota bacterium]